MKKILVLFMILSLFSGCKKQDIVLRCKREELYATDIIMYTFTGDYKKIIANSITITVSLTSESEAKSFAESQKKQHPTAKISVNQNKVTIFDTDETTNRNTSKEEYNYFISMLESDGFICTSEKQ